MPTARATKKCPASWRRIKSARPRMAMRMLIRRSCDFQRLLDMTARFFVRRDQVVEVARLRAVGGGKRVGDHLRDAEERQPSLEERRDSDLVRRVECTGIRPSPLSGGPRV